MKKIMGLLLLLVMVGCGEHAKAPLRIGVTSWPGYEVLAWAENKNLYAAAGVNVQIKSFDTDAAIRAAYERGEIDGMATTALGVLSTRELSSTRPPVTVFVLDYSNGADVILAREGLRSVSDLRNHKIAVEPGTINLYLLKRALEINKMKLDDVLVVTMPQGKMKEAFVNGEVDAVVSYPPVSVELFERPDVHEIFTSRDIPSEVVDLLMFDKKVLQLRAEDIANVLKAYQKALDNLNEEAYTFMAQREKIQVEALKKSLSEDLKLESLNSQEDYFAAGGRLERVFSIAQQVMHSSGDLKGSYASSELVARGPVRQAKADNK